MVCQRHSMSPRRHDRSMDSDCTGGNQEERTVAKDLHRKTRPAFGLSSDKPASQPVFGRTSRRHYPRSAQSPWRRGRKHIADQGFQELCKQPGTQGRGGVRERGGSSYSLQQQCSLNQPFSVVTRASFPTSPWPTGNLCPGSPQL